MDRRKQVAILKQLLEHVERGTTTHTDATQWNDASLYTSADVLRLEKERLFLARPLVAGLSGDLPRPGSFVSADILGVPVALVRGPDRRVRAFLNSCRHRGTRLLSEAYGDATRIACPFHGWSYDLEGRLVGVPRKSSFGEFDRASFGLVELPAAEKHGIIWIRLHPGPPFEPDETLGGLGAELDGWDLAAKYPFDIRMVRRRMNWKLAIDTFGETYHFEILHRRTLDPYFHSNVLCYETFGENHRMVSAARTIDGLRSAPETDWKLRPHSTVAYFLFPNTQLLVDRRSVETYRIFPDGDSPDRAVVVQSVYLDGEPTSEREKERAGRIVEELNAVILEEDFEAAERAQAGLSSGLLPGVVYGRNEPALHHYRRAFRAALGTPCE